VRSNNAFENRRGRWASSAPTANPARALQMSLPLSSREEAGASRLARLQAF